MEPLTTRNNPEHKIQVAIEKMLRSYGWYVKRLHGGTYQSGMPDIFACHPRYGIRLIEVKLPHMKGSKFTQAQMQVFPQLCSHGAPVYIITSDSKDEYYKLFGQSNFAYYLRMSL